MQKYDTFRSLRVTTNGLLSYVFGSFFNESPLRETLYRVAAADHSVMALMAFLLRVNFSDDFMKMHPISIDARIREGLYRGVLLS